MGAVAPSRHTHNAVRAIAAFCLVGALAGCSSGSGHATSTATTVASTTTVPTQSARQIASFIAQRTPPIRHLLDTLQTGCAAAGARCSLGASTIAGSIGPALDTLTTDLATLHPPAEAAGLLQSTRSELDDVHGALNELAALHGCYPGGPQCTAVLVDLMLKVSSFESGLDVWKTYGA